MIISIVNISRGSATALACEKPMNALDLDVLQHARDWVAAGRRAHLVTVVQTWGSAPRQAGAMLALRDDGRMVGSVSGGCIEDDLMRRARRRARGRPARLTYGVTRDEAARFGLPCGGTLRLISEPLRDTQWLDLVLESIRGHRLIQRTVDLHDGASSVSPAGPADGPDFDGRIFRSVYGPRWRLLIIGANQTAQVLASVAATLDFHVTVCDPREEFHGDWNSSQATLLTRMPDDAVLEIGTDERTAIVAVTHDPKLDDMALLEALKSPRSTWARWGRAPTSKSAASGCGCSIWTRARSNACMARWACASRARRRPRSRWRSPPN